jgi:predicted transcriptional regulator
MSTATGSKVKQQVQSMLERLPDDCTLEDVQYHLYVMQRVQGGLEAIDRGEGIAHEDVKQRLAKWLTK